MALLCKRSLNYCCNMAMVGCFCLFVFQSGPFFRTKCTGVNGKVLYPKSVYFFFFFFFLVFEIQHIRLLWCRGES